MDKGPAAATRDAFAYLELLAREAPAAHFDEPLLHAPAAPGPDTTTEGEGATPDRARQLARDIRAKFERQQRRDMGSAALLDAAREFLGSHGVDTLLRLTCRRARTLLSLDIAYLCLYDQKTGSHVVKAVDGHSSDLTPGFVVPPGAGLGNPATRRAAPVWTQDYLADSRIEHSPSIDEVVRAEGLHAIIAVPLSSDGSHFGILYAGHRAVRHFSPDEVALLGTFGEMAAAALGIAGLLDELRAETTARVAEAVRLGEELHSMRRLAEAQAALMERTLDGSSLPQLLAAAGDLLGGSVLLADAAGRTVAGHGAAEAAPAELMAAALAARSTDTPVRSAPGVWLTPVPGGDDRLGYLVLHREEPPTAEDAALLRLCGRAVALLVRPGAAPDETVLREELAEALLVGGEWIGQRLLTHGRAAGLDFTAPFVVVVARPVAGITDRALAWAAAYTRENGGLRVRIDDHLALLLPGEDPAEAARTVEAFARDLGSPATVGAAGPVTAGPGDLPATYDRAVRCLGTLTALGATGKAASAQQLGPVMTLLAHDRDVDGFIRATIGPVLEFDAQRSAELAVTLEAYYAAGGSPTRAARRLYIHPNTVSRRLDRITELLGPQWQDLTAGLDVQLALRLHRIRESLAPCPGTTAR
ncbi:helix-turn-helix domain-containing protein [Streptomyces sp. ISL-36]|uniref:helix-turn-helix domain-containing protein n=1 Tax=Streptomyces sp. ISL-36 TaxID=2819182 RepID=UPI001BE6EA13|nr:helix-turn-helix domain-containing protein [Streptomyces sp. ISL-36]MBT2443345.1 helix-turn-helix domain-containing protein [Streptomyces sp. ISL-36]